MKPIIHDIWYIFRKETKTFMGDSAVLTFFVALTLIYPVVYTYIYSNEVVHEVPVAVVDNSASFPSREFVRKWDASPGVRVAGRCTDMEEAKKLLYAKDVYGILEIPSGFAKELARGDQAHVSLYCDMGGLLNYKALMQAVSDVSIIMGKEVQVEGLPYASVREQMVTVTPVRMDDIKMFNPQSGYATFIIPAILMLVIQQSLLLGVGTLAGTSRDRNKYRLMIPAGSHYRHAPRIVTGKAMAYLPVYILVSIWIFIVVPGLFNLTRIALKWDLFLFLMPFLLGCIFFALTLSFLCKEREMPFLLFVFTSVPLMFMSGISWPETAIPPYWVAFSKIFPSTHGISGYTKMNNMGASLADVGTEFYSLWILAAVYFIFACLLYRREIAGIRKVSFRG